MRKGKKRNDTKITGWKKRGRNEKMARTEEKCTNDGESTTGKRMMRGHKRTTEGHKKQK